MPHARGRGIARALMDHALALARSVPGIRQVLVGANADNVPAIRLYERLGFKAYGREPAALRIGDDSYDELHLCLDFARDARSAGGGSSTP